MRRKLVHRVESMISCNYRGGVTLLTEEDFGNWSTKLMPDLDILEVAAFTSVAANGLIIGDARKNYGRWEKAFSKRLKFVDWLGLRERAYYFDAPDAQKYVCDFLEVYRYQFSRINVGVDFVTSHRATDVYEIPDDAEEMITITLYQKQSLLDRVLRRWGSVVDKIVILKAAIEGLEGNSEAFSIYTPGVVYHFDENGVQRFEEDEEDGLDT